MDDVYFKTTCPSCGEILQIAQRHKGKKGFCKKCGATILAEPTTAEPDTSIEYSPKTNAAPGRPTPKPEAQRNKARRLTRTRLALLSFASLLILALVVAGVYFMPYLTYSQLSLAIETKDIAKTKEYVDFHALEESIKAQFRVFVVDTLQQYADSRALSALGSSFVEDLIEAPVADYVSPEGLATVLFNQEPPGKHFPNSPRNEHSSKAGPSGQTYRYEDFDTFVIRLPSNDPSDSTEVILSRHSLFSWKLSGFRLPLRRKEPDPTTLEVLEKLAEKYYSGDGVPVDYVKAAELYSKVAGQGSVHAQYILAGMYRTGRGLPTDYQKAAEWYTKSAEQGNAAAQYALAILYASGEGLSRDYTRSVELLIKSAEQGNPDAQRDLNDVVEPLTDAAALGMSDAETALGVLYLTGKGVPQDYAKAGNWFFKAAQHGAEFVSGAEKLFNEAAEEGNAGAQYSLALLYEIGRGVPKDDAKAVEWHAKAAEQGIAESQYKLADIYSEGRGVPKDDAKAVEWYARAAEQGIAESQYKLADIYSEGRGVPKDDTKAVEWYARAANQGIADAQYKLGDCYENGKGIRKNLINAFTYYAMAAEQGNVEAMASLGDAYSFGEGVEEDFKKAFEWHLKAAGLGNAHAASGIAYLYHFSATRATLFGGLTADDLTNFNKKVYLWLDIEIHLRKEDDFLYSFAVSQRDDAAKKLTPVEITEMQKASSEWLETHRNKK